MIYLLELYICLYLYVSLFCWFSQKVRDFETSLQETLRKVPEAHDRLAMMLEYELPEQTEDMQPLLQKIRNRYQDVMR